MNFTELIYNTDENNKIGMQNHLRNISCLSCTSAVKINKLGQKHMEI